MKKALLAKPGEWADKVGDKLGGLLLKNKAVAAASLPRKNSAPNLVKYGAAEPDAWEASEDTEDTAGRTSPDPPGPDTSSLSAFLMNLLSTDKEKEERSSALGFPWRAQAQAAEEAPQQRGEFYDVDWLLVDEHVKAAGDPQQQQQQKKKKQLPSISADRLPRMSDASTLLSDEVRCSIHPALPTLAKGRRWVLLYSTEKHGMSLLTLYRNSNMMTGPLLLVAGDKQGAVFGGLITAPLVPSPKKKYQGTSDSFVFSSVTGQSTIFHPTGANRYYVLATTDALALGGGSHFALHVDAELLNGSSGVCETYDSPCLANSEEFILKHVELWGFDHTQRHSSFSEPSPLMTW